MESIVELIQRTLARSILVCAHTHTHHHTRTRTPTPTHTLPSTATFGLRYVMLGISGCVMVVWILSLAASNTGRPNEGSVYGCMHYSCWLIGFILVLCGTSARKNENTRLPSYPTVFGHAGGRSSPPLIQSTYADAHADSALMTSLPLKAFWRSTSTRIGLVVAMMTGSHPPTCTTHCTRWMPTVLTALTVLTSARQTAARTL